MIISMKVKINVLTYLFFIIYALSGYISFIFPFLIILFIHEAGHLLAIRIFKHQIRKIEVLPFGLIIEENGYINSSIYQEFIISISGIIMQVIFHLIITLCLHNLKYYEIISSCNIFIMLFNLCPVTPLDGYRLFSCLWETFLPYKKTFILKLMTNGIFIIIMIFGGHYSWIIIEFLIYKLIHEFHSWKEYYHRFIIEKILYRIKYPKVRMITSNKIDKMYRHSYHYFNIGSKWVSEREFLEKTIDKLN